MAGLRLSLEQGRGQGDGFLRCDQIGIADPLTSILSPFAKGRGGSARLLRHPTRYDRTPPHRISLSAREYLVGPNKLRICFTASIRRAGCGVANQNWPADVPDSEGDANRRGASALFEGGRF